MFQLFPLRSHSSRSYVTYGLALTQFSLALFADVAAAGGGRVGGRRWRVNGGGGKEHTPLANGSAGEGPLDEGAVAYEMQHKVGGFFCLLIFQI